MVNGSAGRPGAAGCGAAAPADAASKPAKKPASQARWLALAEPTTRLRRSISSSANGAVFGIGDILLSISRRRDQHRRIAKASYRRREQVVDDGESDQQHQADSKTPANELFLDRQKRLDRRLAKFLADICFQHVRSSAGQWRFNAA